MGSFSIAGLAASAVFCICLYKFLVFPLFLSPLSKIPAAHFTCHVSPLWIYYIRYKNIENQTIHEQHKQKGPIIRTAPNQLSVNCYEGGLKTIYTGGFHKTDFYHNRFVNYGYANLASFTQLLLTSSYKC